MELLSFLKNLKKRQGMVSGLIIAFLIIGLGATFMQPLKYRASTRILIMPNLAGADPYTVSKSNQYLGNLFTEIISSGSFFNLAINNNKYNIDKNYFGDTYKQQMKIWGKTVSASNLNDSGVLKIDVYSTEPEQARQLALAVNDVLINQNFNYQNGGGQLKFNVIDQPIVSTYPVKPNIVANFLASLIFGIIFSLSMVYLFPPKTRSLKQRREAEIKYYYQKEGLAGPQAQTASTPANLPFAQAETGDSYEEEKLQPEIQGNIKNIMFG